MEGAPNMNTTLLYLLNVFLIIIEDFMCLVLANAFFSNRYSSRKGVFLFCILVILNITTAIFLEHIFFAKLIFVIALYTAWLAISHNASVVKAIFTSLLICSYTTIIDTAFLFTLNLIVSKQTASVFENPYVYYLFCYSAKIMELLGIALISKLASDKALDQPSNWPDWLRILFFPCSALVISLFLLRFQAKAPTFTKDYLACNVVLLFADLMSIFLLDYIERQQIKIRENAILRQNLKLETDHIKAMQDAYAEQRRQTHDFKNQLAVLGSLAKSSASPCAFSSYLEKILDTDFTTAAYVNTHRPVVDVILNQRYSSAKAKSVAFRTQLDDLSSFPLSDDALVVILTNLLDNAIEACEKIEDPTRRYILLKMRISSQSALLYIENPTNGPILIKNNRIATSKKDRISHGYGLKNVYALLNEKSAVYAVDYTESTSTFCFSTSIPIT